MIEYKIIYFFWDQTGIYQKFPVQEFEQEIVEFFMGRKYFRNSSEDVPRQKNCNKNWFGILSKDPCRTDQNTINTREEFRLENLQESL
jgi:hypothetical protein